MEHAVNAHGFAWLRRVTAEYVDLNRNRIDLSQPLPDNPGSRVPHPHYVPAALDAATLAADATIEAYRQRQGDAAEWVARSSGQYLHTDDLLYGGAGPPISNHAPGGERVARAGRWWGDSVTEPRLGSPSIQPKWGLTEFGRGRALAHADIAFVALEFGTHALARDAAVLRDDVWLWRHGVPRGAEAKPIRVALHEHFYPPFSDWQETVLFRSRQVSRHAPEGLTAGRRTLDGRVSTRSSHSWYRTRCP